MNFKDALRIGAVELGIEIKPEVGELFWEFFRFLRAADVRLNLTAVREEKEAAVKLFLDSLSVTRWVRLGDGERLIDVGTGAGFPGVPLAVTAPGCQVVLLEAARKKCLFLESVVSKLRLDNVRVVWGRAEECGRMPEYRERFDWVVARGVAPFRELLEYALPFAVVGGHFVAYKGPRVGVELKEADRALELLGGRVAQQVGYRVPLTGEERVLVFIYKSRPVPSEFPRRPGVARKRPL